MSQASTPDMTQFKRGFFFAAAFFAETKDKAYDPTNLGASLRIVAEVADAFKEANLAPLTEAEMLATLEFMKELGVKA